MFSLKAVWRPGFVCSSCTGSRGSVSERLMQVRIKLGRGSEGVRRVLLYLLFEVGGVGMRVDVVDDDPGSKESGWMADGRREWDWELAMDG